MAKRKARKPAKKKAVRKKVAKKAMKKKAVKKKAAKRSAPRRVARKPEAPKTAPPSVSRIGMITHTELASADPPATQAWAARVLGWRFMDPVPTPTGPYLMWRFANDTGGGIRAHNPPEVPGSIPYCEVAAIHPTFHAAIAAGATEMVSPMELPGGMGWIAIVAAPGGVAIGFWAMK